MSLSCTRRRWRVTSGHYCSYHFEKHKIDAQKSRTFDFTELLVVSKYSRYYEHWNAFHHAIKLHWPVLSKTSCSGRTKVRSDLPLWPFRNCSWRRHVTAMHPSHFKALGKNGDSPSSSLSSGVLNVIFCSRGSSKDGSALSSPFEVPSHKSPRQQQKTLFKNSIFKEGDHLIDWRPVGFRQWSEKCVYLVALDKFRQSEQDTSMCVQPFPPI